MDTSSSDEISVGVVTIARSIFHGYPDIEIIVSGLLPRQFIGLREELRLMWPMIIWETIAKKKKEKDFHGPRPRLDFAWQFSKHGTVL